MRDLLVLTTAVFGIVLIHSEKKFEESSIKEISPRSTIVQNRQQLKSGLITTRVSNMFIHTIRRESSITRTPLADKDYGPKREDYGRMPVYGKTMGFEGLVNKSALYINLPEFPRLTETLFNINRVTY